MENLIKLFVENQDERTKGWFLTQNHWPMSLLVVIYIFFCIYAGPRYMRHRKPYKLKNTLIIYNAVQVILSVTLVYEVFNGWENLNFICKPVNYSTDPVPMRMARAMWLYYIAKITELLDTVFFVLRKNERQVTGLHMYHHISMPFCSLGAAKYFPGGHLSIIVFLNSFVHIFMYSYYLLAAMGPKFEKYLKWKEWITILQIIQFLIIFVNNLVVQLQPDCNYPKSLAFWTMVNSGAFVYMFTSFYIRSYKKKQRTVNAAKQN